MSLDYEMNGIFPTPIYFAKLIKFTDMELKVIRLMEKQSTRNMGNSRSDDTFVLKSKHFENIKKQLMKHVRQYFDKVICTSDKIVPYIDIDLPKSGITKNQLLMLDIIANNDWKRPIYFTGGSYDDSEYIWMKNNTKLYVWL